MTARRPGRRFALRILPWIAATFAAVCGAYCRVAPTASETQLKAAFIFHFTQFIDWPQQTFAGPETPFVIGVFGSEPLEEALTQMVSGEGLGRHPVEVRRLHRPSDAAACQIVYVSSDNENTFRRAKLYAEPVLTVGETENFLQLGGMIQFFTEQNHVRLRINLPAARAAALGVSAKLLRVSEVFSPPDPSRGSHSTN